MKDMLLDFFENTVNSSKLKKSRIKRKITLNEVSAKTGIPYTTLKRYEDGETKKIPFEAVKKISEVYGTDYDAYYAWTTFPLFGSLSGILISLFFGISVPIAYTGSVLGSILGVLGMLGGKKLFESYSIKKENIKKIIYNSLAKEEQEEYDNFLLISKTLLKTNKILNEKEQNEVDKLLFATFMLHKIREKNKERIINFEEAEVFSKQENNN